MSMTYYIFECTACHMTEYSYKSWGYFEYRIPEDLSSPVDRSMGVCRDCRTVVPLERLPSLDDVLRRKVSAEEALKRLSPHRFSPRRWIKLSQSDQKMRDYLVQDLKKISVIEKISMNGRLPVCLMCGSYDAYYLNIPSSCDRTRSDAWHTNGIHPGCGGRIAARGSGGMRIRLAHRVIRTYDEEGQFLAAEPISI